GRVPGAIGLSVPWPRTTKPNRRISTAKLLQRSHVEGYYGVVCTDDCPIVDRLGLALPHRATHLGPTGVGAVVFCLPQPSSQLRDGHHAHHMAVLSLHAPGDASPIATLHPVGPQTSSSTASQTPTSCA